MSDSHEPSSLRALIESYCEQVLSGALPACRLIRHSVMRYRQDCRESLARGLMFREELAREAIQFIQSLRHSKGEWAGQPFTLSPWQQFIVWNLFGWYRADGTRRFRRAYVEIPRKNGKSTLAAALALKLAFADREPGAEVYCAATKRDQAMIVFAEAARMVRATAVLSSKLEVLRKNINRVEHAQKLEPLGADEDTLDGLNVHGAIIDELHAHRTRGVFDVMETATSARRQPMLIVITTAGSDTSEHAVCWEQHTYATHVLTGTVQDDSYFAFIAAADETDDWRSERTWWACNPNLGVSKKVEYLREQAQRAQSMPGLQQAFLRLELNRWVQQTTSWIGLDEWDANAGAPIEEASLAGLPCYGGLDLSSVSDLSACVWLFLDEATQTLTVLPRVWCPESQLAEREAEPERDTSSYRRGHRYAAQYRQWAQQGLLRVTPGNAIDYGIIRRDILEDAARFRVQALAIDRLFQGYQLAMELQDAGVPVVAGGMGFLSMAAPCAELERRVLARQIRHGGHPVLRWMLRNVSIKMDAAGNKKPDKSTSQGKIDGIVALLLALDRVMRAQGDQPHGGSSIYETRGFLSFSEEVGV